MLSEHELVVKVRIELYPTAKKVNDTCEALFNTSFKQAIGPTGVTGTNELAWTVHYLRSAAGMLERIGAAGDLVDVSTETIEELYKIAVGLDRTCHSLFEQHIYPGCPPTGVGGSSRLDFTAGYLKSSASMLERIGGDKGFVEKQAQWERGVDDLY
jgi:hypothetical protein